MCSTFLKNIYSKIEWYFLMTLTRISPYWSTKYRWYKSCGKNLNLGHPITFNEKLLWLNLYWKDPIKRRCGDKYTVRQYVKECGCPEILNELYGIWNCPEEIEWDKLPEEFVLKTTHDNGGRLGENTIICTNKKNFDKNKAIIGLKNSLKRSEWLIHNALHYKGLRGKIICEKLIKTPSGKLPEDYKFYCFHGIPKFCMVCDERTSKHHSAYFMDLNWEKHPFRIDDKPSIPVKPMNFEKMVHYAEILAKGIPFVRIDFYDSNGNIIFGEMTFHPNGNINPYINELAQRELGNLININLIRHT
jgi:hypothetical protein